MNGGFPEGRSKRRCGAAHGGIGLKLLLPVPEGSVLNLTGAWCLKPYWGKPAVRNFREGAGNVATGAGLRPTAKAVDPPPDPTVHAPALYPTVGVRRRAPDQGR
jgi:hypothetical protein